MTHIKTVSGPYFFEHAVAGEFIPNWLGGPRAVPALVRLVWSFKVNTGKIIAIP
jgi:hypothetical protein